MKKSSVFFAVMAAVLYSINSPLSKVMLEGVSPTMMAALLYLGAGVGLFFVGLIHKVSAKEQKEEPLTRKELPFTLAMVALDIIAPILLMAGLLLTTAANASLLNNFEIVATSFIAIWIFKENISKRLWIGIVLVTISSVILSIKDFESFSFSFGSLLVLGACVCWGLENNCTRKLSHKNPLHIVVIKGCFSGLGSLIIAGFRGELITNVFYILMGLLLGFVSFGLSIFFYIHAQRGLGAARTCAYYAISPFVGAMLSLLIFKEVPGLMFVVAFVIMVIGTYFTYTEKNVFCDKVTE